MEYLFHKYSISNGINIPFENCTHEYRKLCYRLLIGSLTCSTLAIMFTSASTVQCSPTECEMKTVTLNTTALSMGTITAFSTSTKTETITASSTCAIANTQAPCTKETDVITVLHPLAVTVTVDHTPDNAMVDQSSKSDGSQTAWMVAAIVFFVIAVSAIVLSIFLGYFLRRKGNAVEKSIATSNPDTIEMVTKGEYKQIVEDDTRVGEGGLRLT